MFEQVQVDKKSIRLRIRAIFDAIDAFGLVVAYFPFVCLDIEQSGVETMRQRFVDSTEYFGAQIIVGDIPKVAGVACAQLRKWDLPNATARILKIQTASSCFCDVIVCEETNERVLRVLDPKLLIVAEMIVLDGHVWPFVDAEPKSLHKIDGIVFDECADRVHQYGTLFDEIDAEKS